MAPGFVVELPENQFEGVKVEYLWYRFGTRTGTYETVLLLSDGSYLRGSFMPLKGFFDTGTSRRTTGKALREKSFRWPAEKSTPSETDDDP